MLESRARLSQDVDDDSRESPLAKRHRPDSPVATDFLHQISDHEELYNSGTNADPQVDPWSEQSADDVLAHVNSASWTSMSLEDVYPAAITAPAQSGNLICYGMLPNVRCQFLRTAKGISEQSVFTNEGNADHMRLDIVTRHRRLILGSDPVPELAQMNSKATFVLLEAMKSTNVQIQIHVRRPLLTALLRKEGPSKQSDQLYVDVNILGPRSAVAGTGLLLSEHGMYLQDPQWLDHETNYDNPHVYDLDVDEMLVCVEEHFMELAAIRAKKGDDSALKGVLDELPQHALHADAVAVDPALVITRIMPHQGEALDFMCKRELGAFLDRDKDMRFWVHDRTELGTAVYRHRVTGEEQTHQSEEPQGGILADEMGLGKTLTAIILVTSSLERAGLFAIAALASSTVTALPRTRATLVVVPSTQLMDSWIHQLFQHTHSTSLRFSRYHGHERKGSWTELLDHDIVFTTYGTVAKEFRTPQRKVLYAMSFYRIVLDEAHMIRTRRTKLFEAIKSLHAAHHWCLTGTPISNKIEDLGPLLDFCRVPLLGDVALFRQHVATPVKKASGRSSRALRETLKPICLRRTKALLNIAEPHTVDKEVTFSPAELTQYQKMLRMGKAAIDGALRIFCNQGTFMPLKDVGSDMPLDADELRTLLEENEEAVCIVCFASITGINQVDNASSGVLGTCSHIVCSACLDGLMVEESSSPVYRCPVCENTIPLSLPPTEETSFGSGTESKLSSKLDALTHDLLLSQNATDPEKSIVFSAWRKTIAVTANLCELRGIRAVRIDGRTPHVERSQILDRFAEDPTISTLLMTIGTGGLGLNITAASRVHILEPQWNPSVEDQAIGRVLRLGQSRATTVIRYVVKDSVEQHVQGYQRRKVRLAAGGFDPRVDSSTADQHVKLNAEFIAQSQSRSMDTAP